ncbi:hypothetical protein CEXT_391561 [Caerostris extrusa]|uniref:Uncharacterized protein n=1 Tax=Caerostris extrusa TaxID=172846 RepID=A0AAV4MND1_CAEEX|nr:hypothetical protein CEXT_391561 [Caerostris extrusa]
MHFSNNDAFQVVGKAALPTGAYFLEEKKARHLIAEYILPKIKRKRKTGQPCVTDIPQNAFSNNDALQVVGKEAALPTGGRISPEEEESSTFDS